MTINAQPDDRKVAWILAAVIVSEGVWVLWSFVADPVRFVAVLGFAPSRSGSISGWILGTIVAASYVWSAAKIPAVRDNLLRPTFLKILAILAAAMAAILEEVIFRKWVMDSLQRNGFGNELQILASGLAFGLGHSIWGLIRLSVATALNAAISTTVLGLALGVVYVISNRSLAACVVAHFVITALIEPGLIIAAVRNQLGFRAPGA